MFTRCKPVHFVLLFLLVQAVPSTNAQNVTDIETMIAKYFAKNKSLLGQLPNITSAIQELMSNLTGNDNKNPNGNLESLILAKLPEIFASKTFLDVAGVVLEETNRAFDKSNVTDEQLKSNNSAAMIKVLRYINPVTLVTRSLEAAKPIIDQLWQKDSELLIGTINTMIKYSAGVVSTDTFKQIQSIVFEELSAGINKSGVGLNISTGGKDYLQRNAMAIAGTVLQSTNILRLISRSYEVAKPVIDSYYGQDSKYAFGSIVTTLGLSTIVLQNPLFQGLKDMTFQEFNETLFKTGLGAMGDTYFEEHPVDVFKAVLMQMDYLSLLKDILKSHSVRMVLPRQATDSVSEVCYNDAMDVVDAAKEMHPWALKIFDSLGKPGEGLAKGRINLLGDYDECADIRTDVPVGVLGGVSKLPPTYPRSVDTRFCRVKINVPKSLTSGIDTRGIAIKVTWGICVPRTCGSKDVEGIFRLGPLQNRTQLLDYVDCSEHDGIGSDGSAIAAICILSVFAFMIVCGTFYVALITHGMINPKKEKPRSNQENSRQNAYTNITYGDSKEKSSINTIENGSNGVLPAGYVHHAENGTVTKPVAENNHVNGDLQKPSPAAKTAKPKEGTIARIFKAFAIQINAPKILSGHTGSGSINCLHGIRFFSITWIILGHTYNYGLLSIPELWTIQNFTDGFKILQRFTYQAVIGAGFSVDTFYMISGLLLTYIQLKQMKKLKENHTSGKIAKYVMHYYFHRFWRLTPMYAFVLMIFATLFPYLGDGPFWQFSTLTMENCKKYWWTNVLYVNNLVHVDNMCMGWSWFLSNDMQFYVVSIILLFCLTMSTVFGCVVTGLLMVAGVVSAAVKEHEYNGSFLTMKSDGGGYWNNVYVTPWCRVAAFCVGVFLGLLFHKRPQKHFSKVIAFVGWTLSIAIALFIVYSPYSENKEGGTAWTASMRAAYESIGRPLWAACVAWVIFACHNGRGGVVDSILSWKGLIPLSRLSYAAYLIHPMVLMINVYSRRTLFYLDDYNIIYLFLGHTTLTFLASFVLSLTFEAPFMALEKLIL